MPDLSRVDLNNVVGNVLRYGVLISSTIITVGVFMVLLGLNTSGFPASLSQLISTSSTIYGKPTLNMVTLAEGVIGLKPLFIIQLGLLILLATPIVRVATSVLLFAAEKDRMYVAFTIVVLAVLLFSIFVVGPLLG